MLSLFFTKNAFGNQFFDLEELNLSHKFFNRSVNGFRALTQKQKLCDYFTDLKESSKLERFILLLKIIETLSKCKAKSLSTFVYEKQYSDIEGHRMRNVFEYTMSHFTEDISLSQISDTAAMTKNAFCKYFKRRTNKSYFTFLNELRIEHACTLLMANKNDSIADIADRSGFNNISNFNRQFKAIKTDSPSVFRKNS
jgi:AraC-like DNA-binding protein